MVYLGLVNVFGIKSTVLNAKLWNRAKTIQDHHFSTSFESLLKFCRVNGEQQWSCRAFSPLTDRQTSFQTSIHTSPSARESNRVEWLDRVYLICAPIHVHLPNLSLCLCFSSYPPSSEEKGALTLFTLNVHSIYHWLVLAKLPLYWFCLCFSESFVCKQYYL